jgi:hypothetical protein
MKRFLVLVVLVVLVGIAVSANVQAQCGPPLPTPKIAFLGKANEPTVIRYTFTVTNRSLFSNVFFTPSPNLPPCGLNNNSARTWLDIFNSNGATLYGYCALKTNADMAKLSFAVLKASPQPKAFYITMTDRLCKVTKKSNVVVIP